MGWGRAHFGTEEVRHRRAEGGGASFEMDLGRPPKENTSRWMIPIELSVCLTQGLFLFCMVRAMSGLPELRLTMAISVLSLCLYFGRITRFGQRTPPCLVDLQDAPMQVWRSFVWAKYLSVFGLEFSMCLARLSQPNADGAWLLRAPPLLLALNIFECVVLEAVCAHAYRNARSAIVTHGMYINIATGLALTALALVEPVPIARRQDFRYNHIGSPWFQLGYALWNIRFAMFAQDNGSVWHLAHSHFWSLVGIFALGTDYMDYRVPSLLYHFSSAFLFEKPNQIKAQPIQKSTIRRKVGYSSYYEHVMGAGHFMGIAIAASVFTMLAIINKL